MKKILITLFFIISSISSIAQGKITYSTDPLGNTVAKNKYGKIIAIGKKDFNGDFVRK